MNFVSDTAPDCFDVDVFERAVDSMRKSAPSMLDREYSQPVHSHILLYGQFGRVKLGRIR